MQDLNSLFEEFIKEQEYSLKLSQITLKGYRASFDLFNKIIPDLTPERLSPDVLVEFFKKLEKRERLVGRGHTKKGVKKSTVATYRSKLNSFFKWLSIKGIIEYNPFRDMEKPTPIYAERQFLKKEEVDKILMAILSKIDWTNNFVKKRNYCLIALGLFTGLRRGELIGLRLDDIDWRRYIISVRAETSKSRRERPLPICNKLAPILKDYLEARKEKKYLSPYLFVSNNQDRQLSLDGLKHLVEIIRKSSGVNFHLHQLRHTFASNLVNNGANLAIVKQSLGHTDIRMTATYTRCIPSSVVKKAVDTLDLENFL
jgi:site-specific recombinase XerD